MPKKSTAPINGPLTVKVERGKLVIEIGIHTLVVVVSYSDWANPYDDVRQDYFRTFAIADPEQFVSDVAHEIQREGEDGSTPLTMFLDKMCEGAINDGSLGLADGEQLIPFGTFSPLEKWAPESARKADAVDPLSDSEGKPSTRV